MKQILFVALTALAAVLTAPAAEAAPTVYIPLGSGNKVIAVDAARDRITHSYDGVQNPHGLVTTPDGEYLIVGSLTETPIPQGAPAETPNSLLYVVHPAHGHVMSTIPVSGWTHHQAITPDGKYVISTHPTRGGISVVDVAENRVVRTVKTGSAPNYSLVTKNGKRIFVSNSGNGTISEIDTATWAVARTLEGGPAPEHLVIDEDRGRIYAASGRTGQVSAISIGSGKVERSYDLGKRLHGLDRGDDGRTLFVTVISDDRLVALDPDTGAIRSRL
ncbi:MAG TPA: YncE family protein, partial [Candidatus Polarisedimenticolaceae bacterium]|nr:YncE family protein [Candidatus Polarisedimenticolaceae bacterium]